jgi:hypothetical protein
VTVNLHQPRLVIPDNLNTRKEIRDFVVMTFLEELAGDETRTERYEYFVEECVSRNIYIARQTNLNKGMDFRVMFKDIYFQGANRRTRNPSHEHIFHELLMKKNSDPNVYNTNIIPAIHNIYNCVPSTHIQPFLRTINVNVGLLTIEETCLALKWLFIEQDITYWGYSGRAKLFNALVNQGLA